jgi:hydrogenase maturation protein HypF
MGELPALICLDYLTFEIRDSTYMENALQPIPSNDVICPDCERELFDPENRRYLYPFINCKNCGPRFTITKDLSNDRPVITATDFPMCDECRAEYENSNGRRFHAQPVTCPNCGPFTQLRYSPHNESNVSSIELRLSAILKARQLLHEGKIVAIKGPGGFYLACDATNEQAVNDLRRRRGGTDNPFALMFADLSIIKSYCEVNKEEAELITGHKKPIVLLHTKSHKKITASVTQNMDKFGVMLPSSPLHHLLLNQTDEKLKVQPAPTVIVMTGGNFNEEPIATTNEDALERLVPLADAFLLHDLDIHER